MKKLIGSSIVAIAAVMAYSGSASAADVVVNNPQPVVVQEAQSPWQIRVRALGVIPNNDGYVDQVPGSDLKYSKSITPELDITYYFTNNFAAELILGTTSAHVSADGALKEAGFKGLGSTWILPPTLTLQYHFTNFGAFKPYIGGGVNYTVFYKQEASGLGDLDIDNEWGYAAQIGFDYMFNQHWGFNFDVKKLWLRPDFSGKLKDGTPISGKAKLDPWLIGAGITYRF